MDSELSFKVSAKPVSVYRMSSDYLYTFKPRMLLDHRYWSVLHQIVADPIIRHGKCFSNLLSRIQVDLLMTSVLKMSTLSPEMITHELCLRLKQALNLVWTSACRMSLEALNNCFISCIYAVEALISFSTRTSKPTPSDFLDIVVMVSNTVANTLSNASTIRKVFKWFELCPTPTLYLGSFKLSNGTFETLGFDLISSK